MTDPTKQDISLVFKRLRSNGPNKQCFDCYAKNPSWASVTYGVFLCIDCSAIHRSLGVHLSFVRSTQLDSWTWQQLRSMQVGGNAAATNYFSQHGCTTKESHAKYNSRAASLYREKLIGLAAAAQKKYSTQLHIEAVSSNQSVESPDFFDVKTSSHDLNLDLNAMVMTSDLTRAAMVGDGGLLEQGDVGDVRQPSVDGLVSPSDANALIVLKQEPKSSLIGKRKPKSKAGVGVARKGLGAQKLNRNFSDIEKQAEEMLKDQQDAMFQAGSGTPANDATSTSSRLDFSINTKKMDPQKAKQAERLGMGGKATRSVGHSATANMNTIDQVGPSKSPSSRIDRISNPAPQTSLDRDDFFSGINSMTYDPPSYSRSSVGGYSSQPQPSTHSSSFSDDSHFFGKHSTFAGSGTSVDKPSSKVSSFGGLTNTSRSAGGQTHSTWGGSKGVVTGGTDSAQQRFLSAKSISSDQYFDRSATSNEQFGDNSGTRFVGSTSISSDDYFGRTSQKGHDSDYGQLKDGVAKVTSKITSVAGNVLENIQDRYHGYKS